MTLKNSYQAYPRCSPIIFWRLFFSLPLLLFLTLTIFTQTGPNQTGKEILIVNDSPETEVFAMGKTVIVKKNVKGVLSFGGDVIIEGHVSGDVATIGGSVIQKKDAYIGGDVIVFGGKYQPEAEIPKRNKAKETVMYAGYEEELRSLMQNPSQLFSPKYSWSFIAQRLFSVLFWFIVSLALTTIAPGAVGRAITRFQLSTLKVMGIGALGFIVTTLSVIFSLEFLPGFVSVIVGLMGFALVMLAYVFGRVAIQASFGKWIMKKVSKRRKPSETLSLFIGALVWTVLLSVPYLWTIALFALFISSLGLVLTAGSETRWNKA